MSPRFVVLTFDDGYADLYSHAFPILKQHGFTATVFLPTDYIGNGRPGLRGKQHLSWDQVRELYAQGITFGSHTCTHPQLYDVSSEEIEHELSASKRAIEAHLNQSTSLSVSTNQPINRFCFTSHRGFLLLSFPVSGAELRFHGRIQRDASKGWA